MLIYKGNWTNYLKSYRILMFDNKTNGFHLTGSMEFWGPLPGAGQDQKGSLVKSW